MKNKAIIISIIIMLLSGLLVMTGCSGQQEEAADGQQESESQELGITDLTDFSASTADGEVFTQDDIASHDLTLINVWTTYCPPCLEEMDSIASLEKSLPDNVGLILLCADGQSERETMKSILEEADYTGINLVSGNDGFNELLGCIQVVPTNIYADSSGHIVDVTVGGSGQKADAVLRDHINELLQGMGKEAI